MGLDDIYLPEFLDNGAKWDECIHNTDNIDKFEEVMKKLLQDDKITAFDFYTIMCLLEGNLTECHNDKSFGALLLLVEALINYFYYKMELNKH